MLKNLILTQRGFTLIELLVVVLIIGILAAIALPQYTKSIERSRAVEALTMMRAVVSAEQRHRLATGGFTDNIDDLDISIPGTKISANAINMAYFGLVLQPNNVPPGEPQIYANRTTTGNDRYDFVINPVDHTEYCIAYTQRTKDICTSIFEGISPRTCPSGVGSWKGIGPTCYKIK